MITVDFVHRKSKPEKPTAGFFYWVEDSTGSQIWFAPSDDPSELILLNGKFSELKNEILSQVDSIYEKKLTWKVIK